MNVTPTDATLGAVVTEVDLADLTDDLWEVIHADFLEYGLLIFPDQHLTEDAQGNFALRFGKTEKLHPQQPGPSVQLSNQKPNGEMVHREDEGFRLLKGNEGWHTDSTYMPLAAKAGMLATVTRRTTGTGFMTKGHRFDLSSRPTPKPVVNPSTPAGTPTAFQK